MPSFFTSSILLMCISAFFVPSFFILFASGTLLDKVGVEAVNLPSPSYRIENDDVDLDEIFFDASDANHHREGRQLLDDPFAAPNGYQAAQPQTQPQFHGVSGGGGGLGNYGGFGNVQQQSVRNLSCYIKP